jgi:hypothetical protein
MPNPARSARLLVARLRAATLVVPLRDRRLHEGFGATDDRRVVAGHEIHSSASGCHASATQLTTRSRLKSPTIGGGRRAEPQSDGLLERESLRLKLIDVAHDVFTPIRNGPDRHRNAECVWTSARRS